ncbi:MAG: tRNA pseudouridine(38-40) synthase TruA [bacterium]
MIVAALDGPAGAPLVVAGTPETRLRLDIAYDGTGFSGWARQPGRRTVQDTLEAALQVLVRTDVGLTVAGRTDAGVHARGQVAHADVAADVWATGGLRLVRGLAGLLPADVRVPAVTQVPAGFDARFSALWRRYEYRIDDAASGPDPLRRWDTVRWPRHLDDDAMAAATAALLGEHDFAAFCRRREGATTVRGLLGLDVTRTGTVVTVTAVADAFCHSMVRSMVGALTAVGEGRRPVAWPATLLGRTDRENSVAVAPAHGLTLAEIRYPESAQLAARAQLTRARRT